MKLKQLFFLVAFFISQVSLGMESAKPDQNELDIDKQLHKAAGCFNLEGVERLLEQGANPNVKDDDGFVLIHVLAEAPSSSWGYWQICRRLVAAGADVNLHSINGSFALYAATKYRCSDLCRLLLDAGADPNLCTQINSLNTANDVLYGNTALHMAVSELNRPISKMLLDAGANPNICDNRKKTPLMNVNYCLALCELLLQYGADPMMRDAEGKLAVDHVRAAMGVLHGPLYRESCQKVISLLSDPEKIRAVIIRANNQNLKKLRKNDPNIFNALMNRELGLK